MTTTTKNIAGKSLINLKRQILGKKMAGSPKAADRTLSALENPFYECDDATMHSHVKSPECKLGCAGLQSISGAFQYSLFAPSKSGSR